MGKTIIIGIGKMPMALGHTNPEMTSQQILIKTKKSSQILYTLPTVLPMHFFTDIFM